MEADNSLSVFFQRSRNDQRVGITHIGIFAALVQFAAASGFPNPVQAFSYDIMKIAKISALRTYCRCVKELSDYGYLIYVPSKKKNKPSSIYFLNDKAMPHTEQ